MTAAYGPESGLFVVSLPTSARRRRGIRNMLAGMGMRFTFVDAIDGDDRHAVNAGFACSGTAADRHYLPRAKAIGPRELACSLSHFRALRAAAQAGSQGAWIVEDDVEFLCRDAGLLGMVAARAPADAAYVQFQVVPPATIDALYGRFLATEALYERKRREPAFAFADPALSAFTCHGAVSYFVTESGMRNLGRRILPDGRVVFPCTEAEVASNMALVADKFVYWAATSDEHHGYAVRVPLVTTDAVDSYLHEDHLPEHRVAREKARVIYHGWCRDGGIARFPP